MTNENTTMKRISFINLFLNGWVLGLVLERILAQKYVNGYYSMDFYDSFALAVISIGTFISYHILVSKITH